jgi:cytochrome P450
MLHDPITYPSPNRFSPERFLLQSPDGTGWVHNPQVQDPRVAAYGFGRRTCPGRFFAEQALFLSIAAVLTLFDILPAIDGETGEEVKPEVRMSSGILS